ncbi:hypothetical protein CRG98_019182 [Punica granatum]|uniref:Uncharacterized protein n=1 Tax=Punica granatum TaxID=22663 RepID=A0A2I0JVW9_PUNGR|nr:hypothetical protein CRG98_019182 [Punica granatum]
MNEISRLRKSTSSISTDGVRQHAKISPALHDPRVAHHMEHPQLRAWPSKQSSLPSGPRGTAFVRRSPRKTSNSSISVSFKGSLPRHAPSYRDGIKSWHVQTLPWRGPGRGPMEDRTHLRIDTSTRLLPGIGAFRGNATTLLHNGQVVPTFAGRQPAAFTLPPWQGKLWTEGQPTFPGETSQH